MFDKLTGAVSDALRFVQGKSTITEKNIGDTIEAIKIALIEADVNVRVVRRFVNQTAEEAKGARVLRAVNPDEQFIKLVYDKLVGFLGGESAGLALKGPDTISTILMMGLNGAGKTTTAAKLALKLKNEGRKVLLIACDLVRPAAAEQLAVLGNQIDVPVFRADGESDPCKVYEAALVKARTSGVNTIIVDTAGRLQVDAELMAELKRLCDRVKPDERLLVSDAMTGQSAADIAKEFDERIGVTGVILTKFDSDARGGAALSLKTVTGKPLKFVGSGEKLSDLEVFHPERIAGRILGMGDVVSFVEKAQSVVDMKEAAKMARKMESESFTLADYLDQIVSMKKMGSLQQVMQMIPGMNKVSDEDIEKSEIKAHEVIILSMTLKERGNHLIIGPSRRSRIAKGSGTSVGEVSRLLKKFEKMRTMMKKMAKFSKKGGANMQDLLQQMQGR
jgi:signal recognition particle subunit SRP54